MRQYINFNIWVQSVVFKIMVTETKGVLLMQVMSWQSMTEVEISDFLYCCESASGAVESLRKLLSVQIS